MAPKMKMATAASACMLLLLIVSQPLMADSAVVNSAKIASETTSYGQAVRQLWDLPMMMLAKFASTPVANATAVRVEKDSKT
ncbi:hypothetical protein ACP70R_040795 [Stipagrostis hirtigluma subsp. patula]